MSRSFLKTSSCPECDREKPHFLIVERPDGVVRCDVCQVELDRVIHAMQPRKVDRATIVHIIKTELARTDYWELPSYRKSKSDKELEEKDMYRVKLREALKDPDSPLPERP